MIKHFCLVREGDDVKAQGLRLPEKQGCKATNTLALQAWGPELEPQTRGFQSLVWLTCPCHPRAGEVAGGRALRLDESQAMKDPGSKNRVKSS